MPLRYPLLRFAFGLACLGPLGCGGDDTNGGSSTTATTSTGPVGTEPRGGVNMEVYATPEQTCPPGNIHVDMGNLKAFPPVVVVDGFEGAHVACNVAPAQGTAFAATGTITVGATTFSFGDLTTDGTSATGSVSFIDAASGEPYSSTGGKQPCVFQFAPGTDQGVEAGRVFVGFDCSDLVNTADANQRCSSRYGYVLVENCGME